jgi:transcriptional regulator with XRE-family HTH domain
MDAVMEPLADPANLGLVLRRLREEAGLSQPQLADMLGVGKSQVSKVERNRGLPSIEVMMAWVTACGHSLHMDIRDTKGDAIASLVAEVQPLDEADVRWWAEVFRFYREATPEQRERARMHLRLALELGRPEPRH